MNITYTMVGLKSDFDWLDLIFYFFIVSVDIDAILVLMVILNSVREINSALPSSLDL